MIWITDTQDEAVQHYTEDTKIVGTIRCMANNRWMASTNDNYLGQYKSCENAQKAVENKRKAEWKAESGSNILSPPR